MKPLALNLSKVKKVGGDQHSSTFMHPDGHQIHIAHAGVSALQRKQLEQMEVHKMAEGGDAQPDSNDINYDKLIPQEQAEAAPYGAPPAIQAAPPAQDKISSTQASPEIMTKPAMEPTGASANQSPGAPMGTVPASAIDQEEGAIQGALKAEQASAKNIAGTWGNYNKELGQITPIQDLMQQRQSADDAFQKQFSNSKIDPNRYMHNLSTGAKIASALGVVLGSIGSATTGGPNYAMEHINKAIDNDIKSQENDQNKSMTLWKMNRQATGDALQANLMTRNQLLSATEAKIKMFQAQSGSAEAQLKFAPILMDIQRQKSENNLRLSLSAPADQTGLHQVDPATLVPHLVKSPEQQKEVYGEIARAQNMKKNKEKMLKYFDDASKSNTVLKTGAGYLREPEAIMALHGLMMTQFKNIDGTVRQTAKDEAFHDFTPMPGDSQHKIDTKRQALMDWTDSESAAPMAKGNGLDLSRFQSTAPQSRAQPIIQTMNGVPHQKVPGGWLPLRAK